MAGDRTIPRLWRDAVARNTGTAYLVEGSDGWQEVAWTDAADRVELLANGLLARGVRKGDAFAILARTSLEWALFDFALAHVGAVGAAIYANSSPPDAAYIVAHSEAVGILCEDETQRAKLDGRHDELPALKLVLTYDDLPALEEEGRAYREAHPGALDEAVAAIDEEDLFTFIYTSGTTGPPKGCMIRHRNYYAMVAVVDELPNYSEPDDVMLLYLPLGAQLRTADAPLRAVRRLRDRVPPGPPRGRARDARGAPVDPPERAARVREGAHGGLVGVRRGDRRAPAAGRLGARRRTARERASRRRQAAAARARPAAQAGRPARLREGEGAPRRPAADADLGRRAAREGDRRVLRRARHPDPRGVRPDGVHDGGDDEPPRPLPVRHRRPRAARLRARGSRRTASC